MERAKTKFSDKLGDNIFEFYNVLAKIRFITSKVKHDIYYNKLVMRVAEPLKT